ncbi:hypothetical protein EVAR_38691_1 [Eumeta japonica]|uniref:Uncharacterized protein n=1 Tax=Eumeta variegata TaxID=151549 RepID=A0A4C1XNQ5_EUMVA|nr:hypothetical protein EVAR_38691_1 [Eumeta japonica]
MQHVGSNWIQIAQNRDKWASLEDALTHWDDEIIKSAGTNWKQITQDRDNWADATNDMRRANAYLQDPMKLISVGFGYLLLPDKLYAAVVVSPW